MDKRSTLTCNQSLELVRRYKRIIQPTFGESVKVYMYGSYSKGTARPESDIDVAVEVPKVEGDWLELSILLNMAMGSVSLLIEPVLIEECSPSPLYEDVLRTGVAA